MYCNNCKMDVGTSNFCGDCGSQTVEHVAAMECNVMNEHQIEVNPTPNPEQPVKKKNRIGLILGIGFLMFILTIGFGGFIAYTQMYIPMKVEEFQEDIAEVKESPILEYFEENEDLYDNYSQLLKEIDQNEESLTLDDISFYTAALDELHLEANAILEADVAVLLDELEEVDLQRAFDGEIEELEELKEELLEFTIADFDLDIIEDMLSMTYIMDDINTPGEEFALDVVQVDTSNYPEINLYVDARDDEGVLLEDLEMSFLNLQESVSDEDFDIEVTDMSMLDQEENLCVNLVADLSGSMSGNPFNQVKEAIKLFTGKLQYDIGDLVELITFSDSVEVMQSFTNTPSNITSAVNLFQLGGLTSFYDALYVAINRTAAQTGAKYVMAFTDGMDTSSSKTVEQIIAASNYYRIPVYIVSIGYSDDHGDLKRMAQSTGGEYYYIQNANDITPIYDDIYRDHKELYKITYETKEKEVSNINHTVQLSFDNRKYSSAAKVSFDPNIVFTVDGTTVYNDELDRAIGEYLKGFVAAINSNNYDLLRPSVVSGSPMEKTQSKYVLKTFSETLTNYEILKKTKKDDNTYHISTRETYEVIYQSEPYRVRLLRQEVVYVVKKDSDGVWRVYDFAESVKATKI